jgi:AcrR family transcriptional regulator
MTKTKMPNPVRRERLLDAAESLFSQRGFYGVTVRQVAELAKVDVALPNYYFDSKMGLFKAVFSRRAKLLNDARSACLDAVIKKSNGIPKVEDILLAFVDPIMEAQSSEDTGWRDYCRLVAQINASAEWGHMMSDYFDELIMKFIEALRTALPRIEEKNLLWGYHFLSGALTLTMANTGRITHLSGGTCHSEDAREAYGYLVNFYAKAFQVQQA